MLNIIILIEALEITVRGINQFILFRFLILINTLVIVFILLIF